MVVNEKTMLINFTKKYQLATRLQPKNENVEAMNSTKLLGSMMSSNGT